MRGAAIIFAVLSFSSFGSSSSLAAQRFPIADDRVRVTAPDVGLNSHVATLLGWSADTLLLDQALTVPLSSVTSLEVQSGRKSAAGLGGMIGALVGAASGIAIAANQCIGEDCGPVFHAAVIAGTLGGGMVGWALGRSVGSLIKTDRWEPAALDRLRADLRLKRSAVFRFGLAVQF